MHTTDEVKQKGELVGTDSFLYNGSAKKTRTRKCTTRALTHDVENLFHSLPHDLLMQRVRECIVNDNNEVGFRNASETTVEA